MGTLFARIPQRLIAQLDLSARMHGLSRTREIARLIDSYLGAELSASLQRMMTEAQRDSCKARLAALEGKQHTLEELLLSYIAAEGERVSAPLAKLGETVSQMRAERLRSRQETEARLVARQLELKPREAEKGQDESFFRLAGSRGPVDVQSEVSLRRRSNLIKALAERPRGTKAWLAEKMIWSTSQFSQKLAPPGSAGYRSISTHDARRLEALLGLVDGVLDRIEADRTVAGLSSAIEGLEKVGRTIRKRKKPAD
ncbi:hypothetical protein [Burkholderia contaminans]|uniref:hypothetical protein n=1 Tax=Burkholderia contaminans TaxID=488447 RepID=UPI001454B428|nr:hypothetical protein [Burkholderia contaminans]MCA8157517.1 hypothetical protein [Burkholderia contaminans]VWD55116.1 hypothetical protein BCO19218_06551 [Burkholderia contaminans]